MAQFNYQTYESIIAKAQNNPESSNGTSKISYFKLGENEEALIRINISSVDQIPFATIHKPIFGKQYTGLSNPYAGISCFNELGSYSVDACPLCRAVANGHPIIGKAEKKCFIPMLVAYKDKATGQWSAPVATVWERAAGFAREIATKLQNYGDLTKVLFKITRVGSGKETRYSLDYAIPTVFKPELIPEDFSAFANFKINKHSYWELTKEQIEDYLATGEFHVSNEATKAQSNVVTQQPAQYNAPTTASTAFGAPYQPAQPTPVYQPAQMVSGPAFTTQPMPTQQNFQPQQPTAEPVRNFNASKFSF